MTLRVPRVLLGLDPLIAEARQRARRRWLIALAAAVAAGGTAAGLALHSSGPSAPSGPPAAEAPAGTPAALKPMVVAALGQRSVHWTETQGEDMVGTWRISSDVTADSGVGRLALRGLPGNVQIRLVDGVAYVKGAPRVLGWFLGLSDTRAARYRERWISVPKADSFYARVVDGLTLGSVVHDATSLDFGTTAPVKTTVTRIKSHGAPFIVVQEGKTNYPIGLRLITKATGVRLPVSVSGSRGLASGFSGNFSKWNEPVRVTAPAQAVPVATVRAS